MAPYLERVSHPITGERPYLRVPLVLDGKPLETRSPSPTFDQHTLEVFRDWLGREVRADGIGGAVDPAGLRSFYIGQSRARPARPAG